MRPSAKLRRRKEERARRQAVLADGPVRVRIVWDAGMSSPVARGLGQAERDWFRSLVGPGPGAWKVRDVTKSALEGFVLDSPAQHQIAVQKIANTMIVFLGQAPRLADRGPFAAAPAPRDTPPGVRLVWDVGMSSPATRELGMAERDWFGSLCGARVRPALTGCGTCSIWTSRSPQRTASWSIARHYPTSPSTRPRMKSTCCWFRLAPATPCLSLPRRFPPFTSPDLALLFATRGSDFGPTG